MTEKLAAIEEIDESDEDVHSSIERQLGEVGRKIHAGRSRNDQVAAAFRLYVADACAEADAALVQFAQADPRARRRGGDDADARLHAPAARAARHARPPPARMGRDAGARPRRASRSLRRRPRRHRSARAHSRARRCRSRRRPNQMRNSIDAVADRDFALDYLYACSRALHAPVAHRRGARALDDDGVRLRAAARGGCDRLVDHAAEAEPRRRRARTRQGRAPRSAGSPACSRP